MSSGQRFVLPFQTVVSAAGVPIPGALLNFYLTGSSTRAPTYANAGLTVTNTNPVPADAAGQFPNIFEDPSITYKVVLTDSAGAEIWTADPVGGSSSGSSTGVTTYASIAALRAANLASPAAVVYVQAYYLTAPTGGGFFAFVSTDTSSLDNGGTIIVDAAGHRWYRLYNGGVTLDDFGAVQDSGVTDNAAAINAALQASRNVVIPASDAIPPASYGFGSPLISYTKGRLAGQGDASILKPLGSFGTGAAILANFTTSPLNAGARDDGIVYEDFVIDANSQGTANIALTAVTNTSIRRLKLLNGHLDGVVLNAKAADAAVYPQDVRIEDVSASTFGRYGVNITAGAEVTVQNPVVDAAAAGGIIAKAAGTTSVGRNIHVINPAVRSCGTAATDCGILVDGNGSATWTDTEVIGGSINAQTGIGLGWRDATGLIVTALSVGTTTAAGVSAIAGSIVGTTGLAISLTKVQGATGDGFYLSAGSYARLTGNEAKGCGGNGFNLDNTTTHCSLTGNVATGNTGVGFIEQAGADYNGYSGNQSYANTGAGFTPVGAHNSYGGNVADSGLPSTPMIARWQGSANGGTLAPGSSVGLTLVRSSAGKFNCTLATAMPNADFAVAGSGTDVAGVAGIVEIDKAVARTATTFSIETKTVNNSLQDMDDFSVLAVGT